MHLYVPKEFTEHQNDPFRKVSYNSSVTVLGHGALWVGGWGTFDNYLWFCTAINLFEYRTSLRLVLTIYIFLYTYPFFHILKLFCIMMSKIVSCYVLNFISFYGYFPIIIIYFGYFCFLPLA